jgi:hypothetical protein
MWEDMTGLLEKSSMLSVSVLLTRLNVDDVTSGIEEDVEDIDDGDGKSKVDSVCGDGDV